MPYSKQAVERELYTCFTFTPFVYRRVCTVHSYTVF